MNPSSLRHNYGPLVAAVLFLAGCGWKTDGLTRLEELYPTPTSDAGAQGTVDIGTPDCQGLLGNWAVQLTQVGTISPVGEPWTLTIKDLFLANSNSAGTEQDLTFCNEIVAVVTPTGPTPFGQTEVPAALQTALAAVPVPVPLPSGGAFQASNVVWLWGVRNLTNPATDPLPTSATDPRVWDQDGDGNPGVTLTILDPAGNQYLIRRAVWNFAEGDLTLDNAWLTGSLAFTVEEVVLGATNSLLDSDPPETPNDADSSYVWRCVGPTFTCGSLSQNYTAVFQSAPK
jgi:hypothetical protein